MRLAVPIMVDDPACLAAAISQGDAAIQAGATLIEWRIDRAMSDPQSTLELVRHLCAESGQSCVITARSVDEGGFYEGTPEDLADCINAMSTLEVRPSWLDVEQAFLDASVSLQEAVKRYRALGGRVIASFHDYQGRPKDLHRRAVDMQTGPVDAVKLVWRARSLRDCVECEELLRQRTLPMIALCMGPYGVMSRVLAGAWGGLASFASLEGDLATAPGQLSIDEMLRWYRATARSTNTAVFGLIGDPIGRSPGFFRHNAAFAEAGCDAVYLPLPIAGSWESLAGTLATLIDDSEIPFRGASITLPHKANLVRFARQRNGTISELVERIGVANTLTIDQAGAVSVENTDVQGIVDPILTRRPSLQRLQAGVIGAGGVARAAVAGLCLQGCEVWVMNRTESRAITLQQELAELGSIHIGPPPTPVDVLVQATSVGMAHGSNPEDSAFTSLGLSASAVLASDGVMLETIYDPLRTPAAHEAEEVGAEVISGDEMWKAQASAQQQLWTGHVVTSWA